MNRIFRIIWSQALSTWVVVSELATRRGKRSGGEVDERVAPQALVLDRGMVEGSPPATAWPLRMGILVALLALHAPVWAADRWWDPNNTAVGLGGSGTWNTSGAFWSANNDGVSGPYSAWNNAALDDAFFGTTPGTITLGEPITVHNLNFVNMNGWVVNGNTLTLGGVTPTIFNAGTVTIDSVIAGTAGLNKTGGGTLTLNGVNTFSGGINVGAGGLTVNGDASLGNASNGIFMANGTILTSNAALNASRVVTLNSGSINIRGAGTGAVRYTGAGGLNVGNGIALTNNANDYAGQTVVSTNATFSFSSIANVNGGASALGAPTTVANGTIVLNPADSGVNAIYTGSGATSDRNWQIFSRFFGNSGITNAGTGTLTLTGNIFGQYQNGGFAARGTLFNAQTADLVLSGVISGGQPILTLTGGGTNRTITLGGANTYTTSNRTDISNVTVKASTLANTGVASSLGSSGAINIGGNGVLSYTGAGASSNRAWGLGNGTLNNDGTGALALSGTLVLSGTGTLGGSFVGADNLFSGVISGTGNLAKSGAGTWALSGANTYTGSTIVNSGTLRAGSTTAFGATSGAVVNGGTLDLNDLNITLPSLAGTGGTVDLGTGTLTLDAPAATNTSYAGNITGSGGLTKNGASTQTLTGTNTYTGATTINGGTLRLDFSPAGGPTSSIISGASTLNMAGGNLNVIGAAGETNTQTFNGLFITAGNNTIGATSGAGGSTTVNLGAITRTGGLVNFNLPGSGNITTTNTSLGGWATVNGTDYAKVVGGNILAFTAADYVNKDNASTWLNNEIISDAGGAANTAYFSTVSGSKQIGGLQYTAAANSTVTVGAGNTLGVDGTIIVAPTVGAFNQTITGGSITGTLGGGVLGIQQNGGGNFTIASQIVDNGGSIGFTKAGTGLVTLTNATSNYTGATTVAQGILSVNSIANGGAASSIGASSAAASNLFLQGSTLRYTGGTTTSDRGFTLAKSGAILSSTVEVSNAASNLTFSGLLTSPDGAGLTKTGAGTLTLLNGSNDYTGVTRVDGGTLAVSTLANGGLVSSIGASSNASGNLVLNGGTLSYTGGTTSTDRGFTVGIPGAGGASGGIGVSNAATTLTMSGTVVGDDGLRKEGAGTLVLSGTNTYQGDTAVNAGTLRAGSTQAFGSLNNTLTVASGATADLNGFNTSIRALLGSGSMTLGSATLTSTGGVGLFSGVISGSGGFTRGGGFVTAQTMVGCNNTYTGATSINGGVISVDCLANGGLASGIGASSNASSSLVFNTGILRYTGGSVSIDRGFTSVSGVAAIDVGNAATTLGFSGAVVGGAPVRKDGLGTLVLSGNNTYTGGTQVTGGILRAGSATAFGNGWLDMANTAGATLDANGFNLAFTDLRNGGTTGGNINLGAQTLTISNGLNGVYAGNINGTGNLIKNGAGTQWLVGCTNSYTGSTTINGGILAVDCMTNGGTNSGLGASSAAASNLFIGGGGTLWYGGAGNSSDRLFTLGVGGGTLSSNGTGALNLTNTGAIALTGTNTARTLTLSGTNTGNNILSAQLDNNGTGVSSLTKTGTGTWILTNNNSSYTGVTTISGGVLGVSQLANGGVASGIGASSSAAGNLVIGNGSTLRYTGAGDSTDRLFTLSSGVSFIESSGTGAINFTNTGTIGLSNPNVDRTVALGGTNTGNNMLAGVIANAGTGITTLAKNDSGTWILTGNNTYTGNTVINNGNLMIGNGGTSGNLGTGNVIVDSATSTLSMNRSDTVIFNATMSGPGAFAQVGTGTTTLTANNSIGATRVSAGTLDVNGVLNTGTIAMIGTSTLNVDGTVQAAGGTAAVLTGDAGSSTINVNTGGILRANGDLGDGIDSLTVSGTLDTGSSALSLGGGNDTLRINDGAVFTGPGVDGGAGTGDNLIVNNALALTFGGTGISGFEALTKQNTGTLTLTGSQTYSAGTTLSGGTLDVNGTLETPSVAMSGGTTLNVDGTVQGMGGTAATLTGTAGVETINVNSGATLSANGDLGDGVDSLNLFGTLDTGAAALNLGAGDETLTLHDGTALTGVGVNAGTGTDQLVLDNALAMTFDGGKTAGFETLLKQNSGTATMTGSQSFSAGTTISGGTLDVDGALTTPTVTLADGTALNIDGSLQAGGGTAATITGSTGVNTVTVNGSLLANGDLGAGNDVLDVRGTLDTGGGTFALGDGDDTFAVHDGTVVTGTIDGGAGQDNRVYNINLNADVGALVNFEALTKAGTGTLNINGPGATTLEDVTVLGGTLNIGAGGSVAAAAGSTLDTVVGSGATLNVDGSYGCGTGNDTMTVSGTVSGSGAIDLCDGDDTLTLNDGAVLSNAISGGAGANDVLVLNNALALSFNAANTTAFERLQKDNSGTATLTGTQSFTGGTTINGSVLDVDGALTTPTVTLADGTMLNVDGSVQAGVGTAATLTGSAGVNNVTVGAGGTLLANGDLGGGSDTLDVFGTLNTGGGTFALGGGNDTLTIHDNTSILGTVSGGLGTDTFNTNIATSATVGAVQGFETLSKTGAGVLNITGPVSSDFSTVNVLAGMLNVAAGGNIIATPGGSLATTVATGATLNVDGSYGCGANNDTMTVSGTVSGSGTVDLCDGDDTLTLNDGAVLSVNSITGGAGTADTVVLNNANALTFGGNSVADFEILQKDNTGEATLAGNHTYDTVDLNQGTLTVAVGAALTAPNLNMGDDTTFNVEGFANGGPTFIDFINITGSDGVNTVTVAEGALLTASGDLGAGDDVLDVAGSLEVIGAPFSLGGGSDRLVVHENTSVLGGVDGGAGVDVLEVNLASGTAALGNLFGFESLGKSGAGMLQITGDATFIDVDLMGGTLAVVGGASVTAETTTVANGATLALDGNYNGTAGSDTFTVAGNVTGAGTINLLDGDDSFTIQNDADLSGLANAVDGGAGTDTLTADLTGSATLGGAINFETLTKTNTGTLNVDGPASSSFATVNVDGGTLDVGAGGSINDVGNTTVASGATLNVDGAYTGTAGNDSFDLSGTVSGSSAIDQGAGDDTLTLHDGAALNAVIDGGANGAGDTVVLDSAIALTFNGSNAVNFEFLTKTNTGTATLTGTQTFTGGTAINGGTLDVDGTLETPTVTLVDDTTLNVDGLVQGAGATATAITGTAGTNTVTVGTVGTLLATGDLGAGVDVLDVFGTLDTLGGVFNLGDGDDSFVVHDGSNVVGTIDGGAGLDTRVYDIDLTADLGALVNFEGVTKTGTGTLNINGPGATGLQEVEVLGGTLNVGAGASVVATAGSTLTTVVASGATLNVDGSFGCGALNDTMDVSGTVSGSGTIDLCAGEDTLTLNDGAVLSAVIDGGTNGTGDTVVLNNANALSFDASNTINFEFLQKDNTGTATLTGTQSYTGGTAINGGVLDVDGALTTPTVTLADGTTLNVDGSVQAGVGTAATLAGSAGVNNVTVGVGGTLLANGDLGAGNDVLDVAGTLDTAGGTFALGDGDDTLTIHDGTSILGTVAAGAGNDTINTDITTSADLGAVQGFEILSKTGIGVLNINGPAASDFLTVDVLAGTLNVTAGGSVAAQNTTVAAGSTLNVDGSYTGTAGSDTLTVAGTVTGTGTLDLLDGNDSFTIQDGADLSGLANAVDGGAGTDTFVADLTGSATLGGAINFETLTKTNTGTLNIDGPAASAFTTVNVDGGTLDVGVGGSVDGVVTTTVASGATLNVDGSYSGSAGDDTMTVAGTVSGSNAIDLADGDDTLTLTDGAVLNNAIDGGANGAGDTVVLDSAVAMTFDASNTINFEFLQKENTGTATLTGTQSFTGGTAINGGTLDVDGTLETPTVTLADGSTLNVDGLVQGTRSTAAAVSGTAGVNTVMVGAGGTLLATGDLGAGADVLDVSGTLDTLGGVFALGDGDDSFVVHDGTNVIGTIDGGAGLDTRVYDIDLTADLGALVNFEGVTKTGTGTLNINGPGATDLQEVSVLEGTLNVGAGASVVATDGSTLTTLVASGATLNVEGNYGCGDGNDSMTVAGTVSGSGTIDLCAGEDTLTLNDGAVLNNVIDGGAHGTGDTVILNNANALSFDGANVINFEHLQKDNTGTATLTGTQSFTGGTTINGGTLDVDGTLETPTVAMGDDTTLNVDGTVQAAGGGYAAISGSAGTNTINVAAGATLLATGGLGDGNDVLDLAGTLDTDGGTFALGDGDDMFVVHDTTVMTGTVDGGLGNDMLNVNVSTGNLVPLGALNGFESLGKSGLGTLQINGPSSFIDVDVLGGTLEVAAGGSVAAQNTTVFSGATLNLEGDYTGTAGDDSFTVAGTVTGSGTLDLLAGNDTFTIQDGADLSGLANPVDGGDGTDTFVADLAGSATLGGAVNFETLTKTNTGTLNIDGLAPSAFTTVNVDGGTLDIGTGGSVDGVVTTTVASGATLNVDGSYTGSSGDDTMTVAGTVSGSGTVGLDAGNDTLTLQDGADTGGLQNAVDGGAGTDTVSAQVATAMTLGPTVNFETLQKGGAGELTLDGDQAYITTQIDAGTLTVAVDTTLTSQDTTVAAGSTLDVQGAFTGTAGDDSFTSGGTVVGALGFADGNDTVAFNGGDISGLTAVDGGVGSSDRLSFSGLDIDSDDLSMTGWERVELLNDSALTLSNALALGVLAIDGTSQLFANAGAGIDGSVENAGLIDAGSNRLAISGNYSGGDGALQLTVSPGTLTAGGLDIGGDVIGNTNVVFASDGSDIDGDGTVSILVIASPNDDAATAGGFVPAGAVDGVVRLDGSIHPWTFGQQADNNWYLGAEAGLLPEVPGYAVLPDIGLFGIQENNRLLSQRLSGVRGDVPRCGAEDAKNKRAYWQLTGDCHGFWMAATGSEREMGANPGFAFSGDNLGLYVGADVLLQDRGSRTLRGGLFAGFQRGNYWTTGESSTNLPGLGEANVRVDTPTFGMYGSVNWRSGTYADLSLVAQLPEADIAVTDGFRHGIRGNNLTLSSQVGHEFELGNGWTLEPQVQLSVIAMQWEDTIDAGGKRVVIDDDLLGLARAAVRAEKVFETAGGARIRPWATLGLQDTVGEKDGVLAVLPSGSNASGLALPNQELGLTATIDIGVEAELNEHVTLFGALSYDESIDGTDSEQRQANLGVRIRW